MEHRQALHRMQDQKGFTLIEIMAGLAIAAVLLCIAVPAFGGMVARHRLATAQWELLATLQHARGLAIASGRRTLLCPSIDGQQCSDGTHWEQGWVLGSYRSDNANRLDGAPHRIGSGHAQLVIVSTSGREHIRFQPMGSAGGANVTFTLCRPGHPEDALAITLSRQGRAAGGKAKSDDARHCAAGG